MILSTFFKSLLRSTLAVALSLAAVTLPPLTHSGGSERVVSAAVAPDIVIYDENLLSGWSNGGWYTIMNLNSTAPAAQSGTISASAVFTSAYSAFGFANWNQPISTSGYNALSLWVRGSSSQRYLQLVVNSSDAKSLPNIQPGIWQNVIVYLSDLGTPPTIRRLILQNDMQRMDWTNSTNPEYNTPFYVDNVRLVNAALPPPPPAESGPTLSVNAQAQIKPISPYIYGVNWEKQPAFAKEIALPVNRWGGDDSSRYNWQTGNSNPGHNWYFENRLNDRSPTQFTDFNRTAGADTLMTLPMIGWAAKDASACGFSVAKYGAQGTTDEAWRPDCGNGVRSAGGNVTGNAPTDTSIATTPDFYRPWIQNLVAKYGRADQGGIKFYGLDNEPGIWYGTHRDLVPNGITHQELFSRSIAYGKMLRSVDPSAKILGPSEDGLTRYIVSGADSQNGKFDQRYDGLWAVEWYLRQMKNYETTNGTRMLDYLDLHYYPESGLYGAVGSAAKQALRLRSVRSLWDPTYSDESWISERTEYGRVRLIPRMRDWVNTHYPGTKLAITEYNFGALNHINGALAQADVLGVFGREGMDMANLWGPAETWAPETGLFENQPGAYAFRMYRNYDGRGGKFGDTSIQASSTDQDKLSVYGSIDSSNGSLKVMVINKTAIPLTSKLQIQGFSISTNAASTYRYGAGNLGAIERSTTAVSGNEINSTYPPNSITLLQLPTSGNSVEPPTPTHTHTPTSTPTRTPTSTPTRTPTSTPASANPRTQTFTSKLPIVIKDAGPSSPYPSSINVNGTSGQISKVTVKIKGLSHTYPADIDMLLVSPNGTKTILMSDTGGAQKVSGVTLTFDDLAAASLTGSGQINTGSYKPTNIGTLDAFNAPAPAGPYATKMSAFNSASANGTWRLFIMDDAASNSGTIASGWELSITTTGQ